MSLKNARGQIAIFVVLIFQVLFILFAMTINIALVVHDKINLQNSLDLAVYYGAKKQAEVLNAMAHINYQMRQNWKLLAWRYRILGTLAQYKGDYLGASPPKAYWCPQNRDADTNCAPPPPPLHPSSTCRQAQRAFRGKAYGDNYCDYRYFVCIGHEVWKREISGDGQNLCTKLGYDIPKITDLAVVAPFMPEASLTRRGVDKLQDQVNESCPKEGALNWLMTQFFLTHFRLDQKDRKSMLLTLYEQTLKEGKDLDGKSIFEGARKVFFNNLTKDNKMSARSQTNYGLTEFNSYKNKDFKDIFEHVNVWPILQFVDDETTDDDGCNVKLNNHFDYKQPDSYFNYYKNTLNQSKGGIHSLAQSLKSRQEALFKFNTLAGFLNNDKPHLNWPIRALTLGFVKKPDKALYYGLKTKFDYKSSIFSLDSKIQFKASAFAKAFGGRFGPQPAQFDPLIPTHHPEAEIQIPSPSSSGANPAFLQPNHSRWPGDRWGLIARDLHANANTSRWTNFLNKHKSYEKTKRVYTMEDFFHLILYEGQADDPLARSPDANALPFSFVRMMEMMAVYPDLYDLSYYSISSNYHQTYFPKICKLLKGSECQTDRRNEITGFSSTGDWKSYIRGDFGWPETEEYIKKNLSNKVEISIAPYFLTANSFGSIHKGEIKTPKIDPNSHRTAKLWGKNYPFKTESPPLSQGRIFYPWLAQKLPNSLLSSWVNKIPLNYENYKEFPDDDRFLNCDHPAQQDMPVASACASGGRSGYSVKLISCEVVKDFDLKPTNINEYCP